MPNQTDPETSPPTAPVILLGTVAIEPNRWGTVHADRMPMTSLVPWLDSLADAGFDGLEVWEQHLTMEAPASADAIIDGPLPVRIFNSYASLDVDSPVERSFVADWVHRSGAKGVKFNVGNDPESEGLYAERIADWLDLLPASATLICECHEGISIAEDPVVANRIFDAAGPTDRLQALVHTHESAENLRARFDAYGDRISHVHVNYLDIANRRVPTLADQRSDLEAKVALLRGLGFSGTWTIEFVQGVLSADDTPAHLVPQAVADLAVLRDVLGSAGS